MDTDPQAVATIARGEHPSDADRREQDRPSAVDNEHQPSWDDCRKGEEHWQFGNSGPGW